MLQVSASWSGNRCCRLKNIQGFVLRPWRKEEQGRKDHRMCQKNNWKQWTTANEALSKFQKNQSINSSSRRQKSSFTCLSLLPALSGRIYKLYYIRHPNRWTQVGLCSTVDISYDKEPSKRVTNAHTPLAPQKSGMLEVRILPPESGLQVNSSFFLYRRT